MISNAMQEALSSQLKDEFYSAYLYLSMIGHMLRLWVGAGKADAAGQSASTIT